ncbi:MAG: polysaccharide biosynthesis/export family protein [Ginsengibacter sp.]
MQKILSEKFNDFITGLLKKRQRNPFYIKRACSLKPCNWLLYLLSFIILLGSCNTVKKTIYFQDLPNDTTLTKLVSKNFESKIQKGDLLGISVASLSPENTTIFNAPQDAVGTLTGYLVDEAGNIQFVKLGTVQAAGLTRKELKMNLEKTLSPFLTQAVVTVGFLNRHVTMMGGVSPQVLPMITDNMTILDALAASGDIGTRGRTDNILVIREKEDVKEFKRISLTDKSIFYSPYFYLQPNDIVYVEPVKEKMKTSVPQIISYVTTGFTFLIFILDRIIK